MLNFKQFIAAIKEGTHDFMTDQEVMNHITDKLYDQKPKGSADSRGRLRKILMTVMKRMDSTRDATQNRTDAIYRRRAELDQKNK